MPPIIRRAPLSERIKAFLNPYDLLLWIAEELHESALDEALRDWGMPIGVAANLVFGCARWSLKKNPDYDIFGEFEANSGWFYWFVSAPLARCHAPFLTDSSALVCCAFPRLRIALQRLLHLYPLTQIPPL